MVLLNCLRDVLRSCIKINHFTVLPAGCTFGLHLLYEVTTALYNVFGTTALLYVDEQVCQVLDGEHEGRHMCYGQAQANNGHM